MKKTNRTFPLLLIPAIFFAGCSKSTSSSATPAVTEKASSAMLNPVDPQEFSFVASEAVLPSVQTDPMRQRLGQFFLVEHFAVAVDSTMLAAIREHQPGGILFWNPTKASGAELREVIRQYSSAAKEAGHNPLLFSTDYEGGGRSLTPSGNEVPGVQRFTDGFTLLAHPIWLGKSLDKSGPGLCSLHGQIMAKELASVGINYPLSTVSDLAEKLMLDRGISAKPEDVSTCIRAIVDAFRAQGKMVFVTKHFPGLGQVPGDTHEEVAVSSAKTLAEMQVHMKPFQDSIEYVNGAGIAPVYSLIASHAKFPLLDPDNLTTESEIILTGVVRQQLGLQGILLSDAMWMGGYGTLNGDALMAVYLNSFLSGMDMLMIPGSRFAQSVTFFRAIYDNTTDSATQALLVAKIGKPWNEIRTSFLARVTESLMRIQKSEIEVGHAADSISPAQPVIQPDTLTAVLTSRYLDILKNLDSRFQ